MVAIKAMTAMKLTREDNVPSEIITGLFLGSIGAAFNKESLIKHGITHILTCADKISPRYPSDFKYLCLPILDTPSENICKFFRQAYFFIKDALEEEGKQNRVLVHCFAGKSRSTSFVLSYLIAKKQMPLKEGLELVRSKRPIAEPNPGFIFQLKLYEKEMLGKVSDVLVVVKAKGKEDDNGLTKEVNDGLE